MEYNLKDVFALYFANAKKVGIKYKIKHLLGINKGKSFYGAKPKLGDKIGFVMIYDYTPGTAHVVLLNDREVERFCKGHELMSTIEKPKPIEEEIKHHIVRVRRKSA